MGSLGASDLPVTAPGAGRRRLILHAGTPRTGTTALQISLHRHSDELRASGILYPPLHLKAVGPPKHQWIVKAMRESDRAEVLSEELAGLLSGLSGDIHTVILSSEGLFLHWWDFSDNGRRVLRSLRELANVEVWVWFREAVAFARSLYTQMLLNPQVADALYGRDISFEEILAIPSFARQLDYASYIRDVEDVLGHAVVHPHAYHGDTVNEFFKLLGVDIIDDERAVDHKTPGSVGVDLIRRINRVPLDRARKARAVDLILQLQDVVDRSPFQVSEEASSRVAQINEASRDLLARDYGIVLGVAEKAH